MHRFRAVSSSSVTMLGVLLLGVGICTSSAYSQTVTNFSFESGPLNPSPGYGPVSGWTTNTPISGNNDATGPFNNGAPIPNGSRVGFIQGAGTLSQTVTGLTPGKDYSVRLLANERGLAGALANPSISLGGQTVLGPQQMFKTEAYRRLQTLDYTATGTSATLGLTNNAGGVGDNTLLLDFVEVTRAVPQVANGGFEDFALPPATFQYVPNGQPFVGWTFTGGAGISRNGSGFQGANDNAAEGHQIGFLQGSSISQTIAGFEIGASYSVHWLEQTRTNGGGSNDLAVQIDGNTVAASHIVSNPDWVAMNSIDFVATSTSHLLSFVTTNPLGGDRTTFIDDVFFIFRDENDAPIAEANGAYVFDANNLSLTLSSAGTVDPENLSMTFAWSDGGGAVAAGANPTISLADTNLAMTTSSETLTLVATDAGGASGSDTAGVSYLNAGPLVLNASATNLPDASIDFAGLLDDPDLAANLLISGFEAIDWEFDLTAAASALDVGDGFLTGGGTNAAGNVDFNTLISLFGGLGDFTAFLNVRDKAGQIDSLAFQVTVVPEPASVSMALVAILGIAWLSRRPRL